MNDESRRPFLRFGRTLQASADEVFDAWTDPASLKQWLRPGPVIAVEAELDVRIGGKLRIVIRTETDEFVHWGEYRDVERPRRLTFTWVSRGTKGQTTLVTVLLRPLGPNTTELELVHSELPDEEAAAWHRDGWSLALVKLEEHIRGATDRR